MDFTSEPRTLQNAWLRCSKPRASLTNICSHCELLACNTYSKGGNTHWRAHTLTDLHAMPGLICLFFYIGGKWQPVGDDGSCCRNCLTAGVPVWSKHCMQFTYYIDLSYVLNLHGYLLQNLYVLLFWGVFQWIGRSSEVEENKKIAVWFMGNGDVSSHHSHHQPSDWLKHFIVVCLCINIRSEVTRQPPNLLSHSAPRRQVKDNNSKQHYRIEPSPGTFSCLKICVRSCRNNGCKCWISNKYTISSTLHYPWWTCWSIAGVIF